MSCDVPRAPAITIGTMTGYSIVDSRASRPRARSSAAENTQPTAAKPTVPSASSRATRAERAAERRREQHAAQHGQHGLGDQHQRDGRQQLAQVDRAARRRRQQQRPDRLAVALAIERARQRHRPRHDQRDPQDARHDRARAARVPSTTKAKLKISTMTTARNVIVANTSRLRHSMRRSLAAMRSAWRTKPGAWRSAVPAAAAASQARVASR